MGGFKFDRKDYVQPEQVEPEARPSFSVQRPLILLVVLIVIGIAGFAAYKMLGSGSAPDEGGNNAGLTRIAQRLDALEHRLDAMEEKSKSSTPKPSPAAAKQEATETSPPPSAPVVPFRVRISPTAKLQSVPPAPPQSSPDNDASRQQREKYLSSLQSDVTATRQQWVATADRMGNMVGELSSQREEITRNRESLEQLEEHFQRNSVPFTLQKDGSKQQVGPVRLLLESTDTKNSRYTMRLFFEDNSIELKGRALHEAIQFYGPDGNVALELIVSQITKSAVTGRVSLPQPNASR
jgi:hypothetical protein